MLRGGSRMPSFQTSHVTRMAVLVIKYAVGGSYAEDGLLCRVCCVCCVW